MEYRCGVCDFITVCLFSGFGVFGGQLFGAWLAARCVST